jgi:hypothetical protein
MPEYPVSKLRKMKYDSPSGYVNLNKYIPPFEPVKNGFGFYGVMIEDFESGKLQCNECGEWLEIFNSHLTAKHNMTTKEYKMKFKLSESTALRSKRLRLKQSQVMIELRKSDPKFNRRFETGNLCSANRKDKPKSLETKNKFGVCDLQVTNKIIILADKLEKTPTLIDLKNEYGMGFIFQMRKRYNSYIEHCKSLNMIPNFSSHNPKYDKEYFIKKGLEKDPAIRILTIPEARALYKYFKGGVKEWRDEVKLYKINNKEVVNSC